MCSGCGAVVGHMPIQQHAVGSFDAIKVYNCGLEISNPYASFTPHA